MVNCFRHHYIRPPTKFWHQIWLAVTNTDRPQSWTYTGITSVWHKITATVCSLSRWFDDITVVSILYGKWKISIVLLKMQVFTNYYSYFVECFDFICMWLEHSRKNNNWGFIITSGPTTLGLLLMIMLEGFKVSAIHLIGRVFMNCEFVEIRKKVSMACFKVLSQHSPGVTEKIPTQDNQLQDLTLLKVRQACFSMATTLGK
jgi:hypothetical protein